jgi:3-deoxy-D-manno-octulosonic-acid transferase
MPNLLFIPFLFVLHSLRLIVSLLLVAIPHSRRKFEQKNLLQAGSLSFRRNKEIADFCFEVSSEGELEQVRPLIQYYLKRGHKIELIFSSPSVEKKCIQLQKQFNDQLRILRLPLLTLQLLNNWVTAPVIIFCRYDFFPELLLLKLKAKKFVLVSAAVKKNSWFKKNVFLLFDIIVAATAREEERFKHINPRALTFAFDFRIERITERFLNADTTLTAIAKLQPYLLHLKRLPSEQRIIIGSAWESDLPIFNDPEFIASIKEGRVHLLIVPHQLDKDSLNIKKIQDYLSQLGLGNCISVLGKESGDEGLFAPIVILNMSGILCEFYSLFRHSYVGGGYERSIHSVFEPFFSGSQVYIGPKIHRSTEYDFLAEIAPNEIHVLFHPEQFYTIYMKNKKLIPEQELRNHWRQGAAVKIEQIASAIGTDVK